MALLIPHIDGQETLEMKAPGSDELIAQCLFTGSTDPKQWTLPALPQRTIHWYQPNGSSWWGLHPTDHPNLYANKTGVRLFTLQAQGTVLPSMYGNILYLSDEETQKHFHFRSVMVPVYGKTFDVKDQLKAMGAYWDALARLWLIPVGKYQMAVDLVRTQGR